MYTDMNLYNLGGFIKKKYCKTTNIKLDVEATTVKLKPYWLYGNLSLLEIVPFKSIKNFPVS